MEYYTGALKKYAEFKGRARRKEFWMFVLFNLIISIGLSIIDSVLGTKTANGTGLLNSLYSLAVIIPSIAVAVRRLHDTNHSGWVWFLFLIPIVGWIILLVFLCTDSIPGENKYGPNPKGVAVAPTPSVA
jgi:uncharacterized membrane protein YhaH (DUF805 family)